MKEHVFPLIEVSGTSYEMGYQHGAQAADMVHRYLQWIDKLTAKPRDLLCKNAMTFLPFLEAADQSFVEEIRGLAEGAQISFEEAMLCQVRAEAVKVSGEGCTAFALRGKATASGSFLAGQNQDLETEFADVALLLRLKPTDDRPRMLQFTFAGQLGYTGMNEYGLCSFNNALHNFTWRPGLTHYMLTRMMLEKRDVTEVIDLYRRYNSCSAANKVICDTRGEMASVEVRPDGVALFTDDDPDWLVHTNHYLTEEFTSFNEGDPRRDSPARLKRMRELIKAEWGGITVDSLKKMLADHEGDPGGICRHGERNMHSISGYIAEPEKRIIHIRRGHGCTGSWKEYDV